MISSHPSVLGIPVNYDSKYLNYSPLGGQVYRMNQRLLCITRVRSAPIVCHAPRIMLCRQHFLLESVAYGGRRER